MVSTRAMRTSTIVVVSLAVLSAQSARAAPAKAPLPDVALAFLAPTDAVAPAQRHLGALVSVMLEQNAIESQSVNVITQGAQAEMLEDMGRKLGSAVDGELA